MFALTNNDKIVYFRRVNLHRVEVQRDGGSGEMTLAAARALWVELVAKGYHRTD